MLDENSTQEWNLMWQITERRPMTFDHAQCATPSRNQTFQSPSLNFLEDFGLNEKEVMPTLLFLSFT